MLILCLGNAVRVSLKADSPNFTEIDEQNEKRDRAK